MFQYVKTKHYDVYLNDPEATVWKVILSWYFYCTHEAECVRIDSLQALDGVYSLENQEPASDLELLSPEKQTPTSKAELVPP